MRLDLEAFGDVQFSREILRVGDNAGDMRPAFDKVDESVRRFGKRQFGSQGNAYSGGWAPLAASTVRYKASRRLDPRILHATLRLRRSFTLGSSPDHVYRSSADEMFTGSKVPYARYHQLGTQRMPRRRPFQLDEAARREILKILQRHLVQKGVI